MYLGYKKSRFALIFIFVFSLVLCVLVWIRDKALPVYIPILATALLLAIGVLTGRLVANLIATSETTRLLGLLHMDLDPEAFLKKYAPVPGRIPEKSRDRVIASFYLSDGYAAAGKFDESLKVLKTPEESQKSDFPLMGTYYTSLIRGKIWLGLFEEAEKDLATLNRLAVQAPGEDLTRNLRSNHTLYTALLAVKKGETIDAAPLKAYFEKTEYEMRRLELLTVFAMNDKNRNAVNSEKSNLEMLAKHGGKTYYASWAKEQL